MTLLEDIYKRLLAEGQTDEEENERKVYDNLPPMHNAAQQTKISTWGQCYKTLFNHSLRLFIMS